MGAFLGRSTRVVAAVLTILMVVGLTAGTASATPAASSQEAPEERLADDTSAPDPSEDPAPPEVRDEQATPPAQAPSNDNFNGRSPLSGVNPGTTFGRNNFGATGEPGEPDVLGGFPNSVWWYWQPNTTGPVVIDTLGADFDTYLDVFTGNAPNALTAIAANNDARGTQQSELTFNAAAGAVYLIRVSGVGGAEGSFAIYARRVPANDTFASATVLTDPSKTVAGSIAGAGAEVNEPNASHVHYPTIWYSHTAHKTGTLVVDTFGSSVETTLDVYTGSAINALTSRGSSSGNFFPPRRAGRVVLPVTVGTTYRFRVSAVKYSQVLEVTGPVKLTYRYPPANDNFIDATAMTETPAGSYSATLSPSMGSANELGEPGLEDPFHSTTVWYHVTAPKSGAAVIDTLESTFDTVLTVYTGNAVNTLTKLVENDNARGGIKSEVFLPVTAGTDYKIRVRGKAQATGGVTLFFRIPPPNDNFASSIALSGPSGSTTGTNEGAGTEINEPEGGAHTTSVWWNWTPPTTGTAVIDTIGSTADSVLYVYTGSTLANLTKVASAVKNAPGSQARAVLQVTAGVNYKIRISDLQKGSGSIKLNWSGAQKPAKPAKPVVTATGTTASVKFTPGFDGGSPVTSYYARCYSANGGSSRATTGPASPLVVTGLTVGKTYYCVVRATNAVGTGVYSDASAPFVPATAPSAPQGVTVARSGNTANVSFTFIAENGSTIYHYSAQCTSSDGGATRTGSGGSVPVAVASLTYGKSYTCTMRATNFVGISPSSAPSASFVVAAAAPSAPTNVVATTAGRAATAPSVSFTRGANNGSPITSFYVQCTSTTGGTARSNTGAVSPVIVSGLTAGDTYSCRVRATNAIGNSPYSAPSANFNT